MHPSHQPVYRVSLRNGKQMASWSRIPSLLLVAGDVVALQIGDIAPADCELLDPNDKAIRCKVGDSMKTAFVQEGFLSTLPSGRTTIQKDSDAFLQLCNGMRIFRVTETPLETFLRKPTGA